MSRAFDLRLRAALGVVLVAGAALRAVLAFLVFPDSGFSYDINDFLSWANSLYTHGPGAFYANTPGANYPPIYLLILWASAGTAHTLAGPLGTDAGTLLLHLAKVPAVIADLGVAALAYRLAARWKDPRTGVWAAALYLFAPPVWYDSAVWGQVDSVLALFVMATLVLLVEGHDEAATVAAAVAVLTKPQGVVCLAVLAPVLLRRHLLRRGPGRDGPLGLLTSAVAGTAVAVAIVVPFDLSTFTSRFADVPVVGDVWGLAGLTVSTGNTFSVLTANAYNLWALAGSPPLVRTIGSGTAIWLPDTEPTVLGLPPVLVGGALIALVGLIVVWGLLLRDGTLAIVLGFTLVATAFFALPTRVHERYLFPAFASGAVLAAIALSRALAYLAAALANVINLHAVLAVPLRTLTATTLGAASSQGSGPEAGGAPPGGAPPGGAPPGGPPPGGGAGSGTDALTVRAQNVRLPLADLARNEAVGWAVAVTHTAALLGLIVLWALLILRPTAPRPEPGRPPPHDGGEARPTATTP